MSNDRKSYLYDLTWEDVKALLPDVKVAIVPVGSTEQHGPHGTFEVDTARAREFAKKLGDRMYPKALVTPCVCFGVSPHHMHFPGTITLSAETFALVLMDISKSLIQHGVKRIFFVNGHGGNKPALTTVVNRLMQDYGIGAAWASPTAVADDIIKQRVTSPIKGHACESEMSQCLYLYPDAVRPDRFVKGTITEHAKRTYGVMPVEEGRFWEELTENGALGDATLSTEALGREVIEAALDRLTAYLEEFITR